jgi:phosphoribosylglycinamide formyltransferase-1
VTRLGILLSGRGSNFLAIHRAIHHGHLPEAEIAVVLSNRMDALGLAAAHELGLPAIAVAANGRKRAEQDAELVSLLHQYRVDLVCLAGYMRLISPGFVRAFPDRILNIHPSLLPAFPGLHAQRQAIEYGVTISGCTVHFVDEELDHGAVILQRSIPVEDGDTAESLAARILEQEHRAYPEGIARVISRNYEVQGRRYVRIRPQAAHTPSA